MEQKDIEKLAKLSRLSLKEDEKEGFVKDFNSILGYVSEINTVVAKEGKREVGLLSNVMRADGPEHEPGINTEALLSNAPKTQNNFVKVGQVFE